MAKRWYVVHTYSGYENKVKVDLEHRIETFGLENVVVDIQIPTEEVTELKEGGKRETKEAKVFPGYVLVRMEIDDNSWAVVRNTPGVTGFVGIDGKPTPLTLTIRTAGVSSTGSPISMVAIMSPTSSRSPRWLQKERSKGWHASRSCH